MTNDSGPEALRWSTGLAVRGLATETKIGFPKATILPMPDYRITDEHLTEFERNGAICLRGFVGEQWLERLRGAAREAMEMVPTDPGMYYFKRIRLWQRIAAFQDFCTGSHLPEMAARLLRTDKTNLLYDQLFVKDTSMVERTTWHNDQPYWPVRGGEAVSFWVALEDLDTSMGTLEFIRGSHAWQAWYQPIIGDEVGLTKSIPDTRLGYVPMPDFETERDRHEMIQWDLAAGDAIAFHSLSVHGSTGNTSGNAVRWAYSVRYAAKENRYLDVREIPGHNVDLENPELNTSDLLDSEMFPVVYRSPDS